MKHRNTHEEWFCSLWGFDELNYSICSSCGEECSHYELPKDCCCANDQNYIKLSNDSEECKHCYGGYNCMVRCTICKNVLRYGENCKKFCFDSSDSSEDSEANER